MRQNQVKKITTARHSPSTIHRPRLRAQWHSLIKLRGLDVAVEVVAQDAGIATLRAAGHGLADEGHRTHFALSTIPSFPRCLRGNGPSRPKKRFLAGSTSATNPGS